MLEELNSNGHKRSPTELRVFLYPGPDGRRPIDWARQCNMSRQAMYYVIAGLEHRGYIERHAGGSPSATTVRMTDKGWAMGGRIRGRIVQIEKEWAAHLGEEGFQTLRQTLHDLSLWLDKLD